jgi:hypothetical protein
MVGDEVQYLCSECLNSADGKEMLQTADAAQVFDKRTNE